MTIKPKIIVVGAGLSGMMSALSLAKEGALVTLITHVPLGRTNGTHENEFLNAVLDGESSKDSLDKYVQESLAVSQNLADAALVREMGAQAPALASLLIRLGIHFDRTSDGFLKTRQLAGSSSARSLSGPALTRQITQTFEKQIRVLVSEGRIKLLEGWDFLSLVLDFEKKAHGVVCQNKNTMEIISARADAVILAVGGMSGLYGKYSLFSRSSSGTALARVFRQGAFLSNCEFVSFYPFAWVGHDSSVGIPFSVISEKTRVWVERDGIKHYILENSFKEGWQKKAQSQDSRIVMSEMKNKNRNSVVFLDLSSVANSEELQETRRILKNMVGIKIDSEPVPVMPVAGDSLGGAWTDERFMTNIPGVFAVGSAVASLFGAESMPGNSVPAALFSAAKGADEALAFAGSRPVSCDRMTDSLFEQAVELEKQSLADFFDVSGPENLHLLSHDFFELMHSSAGVVRDNTLLRSALNKITEFQERSHHVSLSDKSRFANGEIFFLRDFRDALCLGKATIKTALARDESRGVHYKPEFAHQEESFNKKSKLMWANGAMEIHYEDGDAISVSRPQLVSIR